MLGSRIFGAAATGTQYSAIMKTVPGEFVSVQISHPASTTTTYTIESSNTPQDLAGAGPAYSTAVFTDDDVRDNDNVALGAAAKTSAATFVVDWRATKALYRVKMVTSSGTGTITVDRSGA